MKYTGGVRMQIKKAFRIGITCLLLLCLLAGCQSGGKDKKAVKKADYYIGVVDDNAPYYYKDSDGTEQGIYVAYLDNLAKEQSFTYEFVPVDAPSCEQNLLTQSIDGFIGSNIINTEIKSLSETEISTANLCVLSPKEVGMRSLQGLKDKGIASLADGGEEIFAKYLANKYKAKTTTFSSVTEAKSDIENGYSQALVIDEEYYNAHKEDFANWICLKISSRFQNKHMLYIKSK